MRKTLQQILQDVGASIDQDVTLPSGTELLSRSYYANKALEEWGNSYQWESLKVKAYTLTYQFSGASFALPTNFKKPLSPVIDASLETANQYPFINSEDRYTKLSTDKYAYLTGDDAVGWAVVLNPRIGSGASLQLDYLSYPSSMATLQDVCVCPHPEFIVKRTEAFILEARSDPRFPQTEAKAQLALDRHIEDQDAGSGGQDRSVPDRYKKRGYVIGE